MRSQATGPNVARKILAGEDHKGLRWTKAGKVSVKRTILPPGFNQTMVSRAKILKKAIGDTLNDPDRMERPSSLLAKK